MNTLKVSSGKFIFLQFLGFFLISMGNLVLGMALIFGPGGLLSKPLEIHGEMMVLAAYPLGFMVVALSSPEASTWDRLVLNDSHIGLGATLGLILSLIAFFGMPGVVSPWLPVMFTGALPISFFEYICLTLLMLEETEKMRIAQNVNNPVSR